MNSNEILVALRRIMRAIDLHSKQLERLAGLTVPQLLVMKCVLEAGELSVGDLARGVSLSQGTVTSILKRLELKGLVAKQRPRDDRRKVLITLTDKGQAQLSSSPELLQQEFMNRFEALQPWEQKMLTSAVERIATIMDAEAVDASPILQIGEILPETK
jgi:DNA-binding MarR family transcriptional regulator